ncbi:pirin family protein [Microscilla marina]|uniref:Pirin, N-terminal:Pirin, C-terminal n=1 Tax=Microscilla marina ATCC 23134 TaxID=313606 RepID=A1ZH92_MICM2|nr:pirin family protein [Microscilla marina]EAY30361.1 pirin, N-terminal:Pirin, C-terminal [Microscilla marina ATCC 23134]
MANNKMLLEEKSRDIGNFVVGRLLPVREKRQVGPFTFIDHMGPSLIDKGKYVDVDQHPHTGLSTLTYLFEGEIAHRDSTGAHQVITPGDVGFMTSGSGVAHTERTPQYLRGKAPHTLHGYQVWVALPKEKEEMSPRFDFIPKTDLPRWQENNLMFTLVAGEGYGKKSPLPVYSPLFMVDIKATKSAWLDIKGQLEGEVAVVVVKGKVTDDTNTIEAGQMLVSKTENECCIQLEADTQLLLFGGQPLPEPRYLFWNFVSSSRDRLKKASEDWKNKQFPKVPGDDTYIPVP